MTTVMTNRTGAELKVALGGLGLPPSWFADHMGKTMRTVVRWFDGDVVSNDIAVELERISERALDEMRRMIADVDDDADPVVLKTYRTDSEVSTKHGKWPASWHRMVTFRVAEHLRATDRDVRIEYR